MIAKSQRDVSLDYLRATLTLMVVAHHSCLAYTTFARRTSGGYLTKSALVVDPADLGLREATGRGSWRAWGVF